MYMRSSRDQHTPPSSARTPDIEQNQGAAKKLRTATGGTSGNGKSVFMIVDDSQMNVSYHSLPTIHLT